MVLGTETGVEENKMGSNHKPFKHTVEIDRAARMRRKFRVLGRKAMNNLYWLNDPEDDFGQDIAAAVKQLITKKKEGILKFKDKVALMHPAENRSEKDRQRLNNIVSNLKCFRRYPKEVKSKLSDYAHFVYFGPNRTIVREGNEGWAMYFVTSGEVQVSVKIYDPLLNVTNVVVVGTMKEGSMFGEVSLLHDIPRTATITSIDHVELLEINKTDFNTILKSSVMEQWIQVQNVLSQFDYFKQWDQVTIRECCILARLQNYKEDEIILGDNDGSGDYAYFVSAGQVNVVAKMDFLVIPGATQFDLPLYRYLPAERSLETKKTSSHFFKVQQSKTETLKKKKSTTFARLSYPSQICTSSKTPYLQTKFMEIAVMDKLSCFGIGEDWDDRRYISATDSLILKIPQYWLMKQVDKGNIFKNIAYFLNNAIPETKMVFDLYVNEKKWKAYRKSLFYDVYNKKKHRVITTITDVPYSLRM